MYFFLQKQNIFFVNIWAIGMLLKSSRILVEITLDLRIPYFLLTLWPSVGSYIFSNSLLNLYVRNNLLWFPNWRYIQFFTYALIPLTNYFIAIEFGCQKPFEFDSSANSAIAVTVFWIRSIVSNNAIWAFLNHSIWR